MNYARIKNDEVVKYPYCLTDLHKETPNQNFQPPYNFDALYALTPEAQTGEYSVVFVNYSVEPEFNSNTQRICISSNPPYLQNNLWFVDWEILEKANIPYKIYQGTPISNIPYTQPKS